MRGNERMRITYDPKADTVTIVLREGPVSESDEVRPGIIVDYDREGRVLGFEILDAREHVTDPQGIHYEVAARHADGR